MVEDSGGCSSRCSGLVIGGKVGDFCDEEDDDDAGGSKEEEEEEEEVEVSCEESGTEGAWERGGEEVRAVGTE